MRAHDHLERQRKSSTGTQHSADSGDFADAEHIYAQNQHLHNQKPKHKHKHKHKRSRGQHQRSGSHSQSSRQVDSSLQRLSTDTQATGDSSEIETPKEVLRKAHVSSKWKREHKRIWRLFKCVDYDGSNLITMEEFSDLMLSIGHSRSTKITNFSSGQIQTISPNFAFRFR